MRKDTNNETIATISHDQAWKLAVDVTNRVGTDEAKSLNVLVYLAITGGNAGTFRARLKSHAKFLSRLRLPIRKVPSVGRKGSPLFAFLYDTAANTNNLMPAYRAAEARGWQPNTLTGEGVDSERLGLRGTGGSVSVTELMSFTTAKEWLATLSAARKQFAAVQAELKRQGPEFSALLAGERDGMLGELSLGMVAARGLRRLYQTWEPSLVVSTSNMWPFDQAMYVEACRAGIPSFVIQHGITNRYWWPFVATKMLCWGKRFENELLGLGVPAEMLAVCGMPAADNLFSRYQKSTGAQPGQKASSYVILSDTHARHLHPDVYPPFKKLLLEVVAATPNIKWSVKLHPAEDEEYYQEFLDGRFPNFSILSKSTSLEQAVTQADVACTLWSTSGLEAMMMRRPLLVCDVAPTIYDYAWWPKSGGGIYTPTAKAMLEFIRQASSDGNAVADLLRKQDQFLADNFANPGRAANAALDTMESVVKKLSAPPAKRTSKQPEMIDSEAVKS